MADFDDLSYGDETRRHGDYIGVPHDFASGGTSAPLEGQAVSIDGSGNIKKYENGEVFLGVLHTYNYYYDPSSGPTVDPDKDATVKVSGTVKAEVSNDTGNSLDVAPGDALGVDTTNGVAGVLDSGSEALDVVALMATTQDDRPDGTTAYYADVLLR